MRRRTTFMSIARYRWVSRGLLVFLSACAFVPHQNEWIIAGHTTREEVVEAYGQPDLVMAAAEGETVVYRSRTVSYSKAPMEIPTAQAGPRGMAATKMEPVVRGYGSIAVDGGLRGRPDRELRIHYDAQGIVRELIQ